MIDTSKAKWDFSKQEKYAIDWFNTHGFDGIIERQYVSKLFFSITKDGITDRFELHQDISLKNMPKYMERFSENWNILCELQQLRKLTSQK